MSQVSEQLTLFNGSTNQLAVDGRSSTFVDNMKLPIHRWFRYSAGFSAAWVKEVIAEAKSTKPIQLFDPFAGSGTTLLAGQVCGVDSYGIEAHPFIVRVARAKLFWDTSADDFGRFAENVQTQAKETSGTVTGYPDLIQKCFSSENLLELDALKQAWLKANDNSAAAALTWLGLTGILRACSPVGTSQMELIQPRKRKQKVARPFDAFLGQVALMKRDMRAAQGAANHGTIAIFEDDARYCAALADNSINLVITSPPYVNNFDYADATRLEMSFWGEVTGWGDLQDKVRRHLIRSCAQHMSPQRDRLVRLLTEKSRWFNEGKLQAVCEELEKERLLHGGKKNYHLMVAAYFSDMAQVWRALRRVCAPGSRVCFIVGDSAPYGVYVPVYEWLGELALDAGFARFSFEKTRDRNTKWKNRKHRVPLCEGRLWVEG